MKQPAGTRIWSLSLHADYRCEHSGACCTAGWPIPIERSTRDRLKRALLTGHLELPETATAASPFVSPDAAPPETPVVTALDGDGTCAFYERQRRRCAIQRQLGPTRLPIACQQFPRVSLLDGRGLFVNLSHFCPTAARQVLRDDVPLRIVEAPPAFPPQFPFDPLDARAALPPLLKPGVLLDLETFRRWEKRAVAALGRSGATPERSVTAISAFTDTLRAWTPARGDLGRHFDNLLERTGFGESAGASTTAARFSAERALGHYQLVLDAVPDVFRPVVPLQAVRSAYEVWVERDWEAFAAPVCRYLATKLFGSWIAYQGRGLRTIVHSLAVSLSVLQANAALACHAAAAPLDASQLVAAIRRTDGLLVHLASREALARSLSAIEKRERA